MNVTDLKIDVSFTKIGAMCVRVLADSEIFQKELVELKLSSCNITDIKLKRLISKGFQKL